MRGRRQARGASARPGRRRVGHRQPRATDDGRATAANAHAAAATPSPSPSAALFALQARFARSPRVPRRRLRGPYKTKEQLCAALLCRNQRRAAGNPAKASQDARWLHGGRGRRGGPGRPAGPVVARSRRARRRRRRRGRVGRAVGRRRRAAQSKRKGDTVEHTAARAAAAREGVPGGQVPERRDAAHPRRRPEGDAAPGAGVVPEQASALGQAADQGGRAADAAHVGTPAVALAARVAPIRPTRRRPPARAARPRRGGAPRVVRRPGHIFRANHRGKRSRPSSPLPPRTTSRRR